MDEKNVGQESGGSADAENMERQADEIEALSSIYGEEWCVLDPVSRLFCIKITDGLNPTIWKLNLHVHMPATYPMQGPPEYQINAGWLRGEERNNIQNKLDEIFCDNLGEDLIYLWVESLREFLQDKADRDQVPSSSSSESNQTLKVTEEETNVEDEFDLSQLGEFVYERFEPQALSSSTEIECPEILHGDTVTDRRSTFQPHLARINHKSQISQVLGRLYENKKIANASHNMLAYRITPGDAGNHGNNNNNGGPTPVVYQGCEDDGETHAGSRMLHLLQIMNAENVLVVVSRWYGGVLLGADRFKHINNCTRQILEQHGFLRGKDERKGPRSGKKNK